jgi:hypothetical protein
MAVGYGVSGGRAATCLPQATRNAKRLAQRYRHVLAFISIKITYVVFDFI